MVHAQTALIILSNGINRSWNTWKGIGGGAVIGAASGVAAAMVGSAVAAALFPQGVAGFSAGFTVGAASGATAGVINGAGYAALEGQSFGEILKAAFWEASTGFFAGGITGGLSGMWKAFKEGRNLWNGNAKSTPTPTQKIVDPKLDQMLKDRTSSDNFVKYKPDALKPYYPENNGALGEWKSEVLQPGTKISRLGVENGLFAAPEGTPPPMRSLSPGNYSESHVWEVVKPLPVQSSTVAPAFSQPGMGTQYLLPASPTELVDYR